MKSYSAGTRFFAILTLMLGLVEIAISQPNLSRLELEITPDFNSKSIRAKSLQHFTLSLKDTAIFFLFDHRFVVDSIVTKNISSKIRRRNDSISISFKSGRESLDVQFFYSGIPQEAKNPPWDDGFVWKSDENKFPWLGVTCQTTGAKLWWPAPSIFTDKPKEVKVTCIYPRNLFFKGNGRMTKDTIEASLRTTSWEVSYPINTYNVTLNIADYSVISDTLFRNNGTSLLLHYYPLSYHKKQAEDQFAQVKPMLRCFESRFCPYPFEKDGYSVVETFYAGMEHQSAIGYGNGYENGYNGLDYSTLNLPFDFILIHESGHEWFGNAITAARNEDFWFQEAFCTYAEMVYVDCLFGDSVALKYINAKKRLVENKVPIFGKENNGIDLYAKGALMIHTMSQLAGSKLKWEQILRNFVLEFKYKSVTTEQISNWFCQNLKGLTPEFFDQYLLFAEIPSLEYKIIPSQNGNKCEVRCRITNAIKGFSLPLQWETGNGKVIIHNVGKVWSSFTTDSPHVFPDETRSYFSIHNLH